MDKLKFYPRFSLHYVTSKSLEPTIRRTKHKKSFTMRLNGLSQLKTLKKCWFVIEYSPKTKNESIEYADPKEALRVAKIFTTKSEIDSCM